MPRPGPAVPAQVLTKAFSEFLTKRFGGSAWLADIGPDALQQFAASAWALDSGASQFCIMGDNADDAMWETVQSADCDIDTGAGTARPTAMVDAKVPRLGRRSAMVMPESKINMASMGDTCAEMGVPFLLNNCISGAMEVPAKFRSPWSIASRSCWVQSMLVLQA